MLRDSIPVFLVSGEVHFSYGVGAGWQQVGEIGRVTRATGAVVYEIDGAPAIDFYRKDLGRRQARVELPLAILNAEGETEYLRATWGEVDEAPAPSPSLGPSRRAHGSG